MATTVSFINMKGGVGKTTLAFNLAYYAAQEALLRLRVLAVDLDPQANLSQCLLGEMRYLEHVNKQKPTTGELFEGMMPPSESGCGRHAGRTVRGDCSRESVGKLGARPHSIPA